MFVEVCVETIDQAKNVLELNVNRLELCTAISLGGLTPSFGFVSSVLEFSKIPVFVLIRPRPGGFVYSYNQIKQMRKEIINLARMGVQGVVFGVLNSKYEICKNNIDLVQTAKSYGLRVTFHRAFDQIEQKEKAIEKLIDLNFDQLLTSAGALTAAKGVESISKWNDVFGEQIDIIAAGGINSDNVHLFCEKGIRYIHCSSQNYSYPKGIFKDNSSNEKLSEKKVNKILQKIIEAT